MARIRIWARKVGHLALFNVLEFRYRTGGFIQLSTPPLLRYILLANIEITKFTRSPTPNKRIAWHESMSYETVDEWFQNGRFHTFNPTFFTDIYGDGRFTCVWGVLCCASRPLLESRKGCRAVKLRWNTSAGGAQHHKVINYGHDLHFAEVPLYAIYSYQNQATSVTRCRQKSWSRVWCPIPSMVFIPRVRIIGLSSPPPSPTGNRRV